MDEIISILMRRDGLSYDEAYNAFQDCKEQIEFETSHCANSYIAYENAVDILREELGLEPDYLEYFWE